MGEAALRLLTPDEAAQRLGVSRDTFDRHVRDHVPHVRIGRLLKYDPRDLDAWLDEQKAGSSSGAAAIPAKALPTSASRTLGSATRSPQVSATLARLRRAPRKSTPAS